MTNPLGTTTIASTLAVAIMLGAASGASAQCAATHHPSSGTGAHSAASSSGVHSTTTASAPHANPSCATGGKSFNAVYLAGVHSPATAIGVHSAATGLREKAEALAPHRTAAETTRVKSAADKKVKP